MDDFGVQQHFSRVRIRRWLLLIAGAAMFIGSLALIDHSESSSEGLAANGVKTPATVVSLGAPVGRLTDGSIQVRYSFSNADYRQTIYLDDTSPQYRVGESVTIAVDSKHPRRVAISTSDNIPPLTLWAEIGLFIGGPLLMIIGISYLVDSWRSKRLAKRFPWVRTRMLYLWTRGQAVWLYQLTDGQGDLLRGGGLVRRRSGLMPPSGTVEVDVAGDGPALIRLPGTERIVRIIPAKNRQLHKRWNRQYGTGATLAGAQNNSASGYEEC